MRLSKYYAPTLKEDPADAEVVSHKLLMRAGMIRKLTSGIYNYLPLGLRSINKVAQIVREEMDRSGAMEVLMPMVQPADLWRETGRWDYYGKELLRINDRHGRDYCLGPTHEEVITDLVRGEIKSYKQLPINLYQIQTKFRDEIRPRFGLMRGREFIMKDAYSFDKDEEGAEQSYWTMFEAYKKAFARIGLRFKPVQADSGAIGGDFSHEFMVLAETGEDTIASCKACEFAANLEKAKVAQPKGLCNCDDDSVPALEEVETPGKHTVEEVCDFLSIPASRLIKTLLFVVDGNPVAALVRGDRELNDVKLRNLVGGNDIEMADEALVKKLTNAPVGFAGPAGLNPEVPIYADQELCVETDWVAGANKGDTHVRHLSLGRDCTIEKFADLRVIEPTDPCPECAGEIEFTKGIEVGHVFKLGVKYSEKMEATFLDENGKAKPMIMGCYGIGVSRIVASAIEQNHDENGCCFPPSIAPFEVCVISLGGKDQAVTDKAEELYSEIKDLGVDICYDDRKERPGVKFAEADLIGYPMQLVLGGKGLKNGIIEAKNRKTGEKIELPLEGFKEAFQEWRTAVWGDWGL
ncbi:prolyl-tRNA synthetase [Pseudodesulfovibrio profundus]|uniref:Proline--tRNA ligase n=1 Tax=Pseudodesulfovibrio profundus TaxID=57320 RepID=A0A2C8FC09_9BACT|nr:proline--tRNA ligase [Pseudodesulfovibrio profundus]SOB59710.1 prolyl-tRNA synthetase [Pseudodesulfovibrio profundus]